MPEFSVKKPLTIFVATIAILVLGVVAYVKMTPDLLPNMDFPYVIIMTTSPGDSPEAVEAEITKPIEQSMATLDGIVTLVSNSADSYSMVMLEFEEGTNLDTVGVDIQQKISILQGSWDDTVGTPYVLKINPSMLPIAMAAVSMEGMDIIELSEFADDTLMGRLEGVSGVARVSASGMVDEQLHVVISQEKIDELNDKVADGINKKINKAASSLRAAKNQINGALTNMGSLTGGMGGNSNQTVDTSGVDAQIASMESEKKAAQKIIDELNAIKQMENTEEAQAELDKLGLGIAYDQIDSEIASLSGELFTIEAEIAGLKLVRESIVESGVALGSIPDSKEIQEMLGTVMQGMLQMSSAVSQIDSGLNTIESSRKDALSQANLNNILSLETVSQILYAQNFSMPAGYVEQDGINYMVSVGDNFSSVEELQNLMLFDFGLDDVEPIYLGDVADIFVTDNSADIYTRLGTENGLMLTFEKQSNYATAEVSEGIQKRFEQLEAEYEGLEFFLLMDQGDYIMYIVDSILESLLFGALFSVLVLFIFLKDIRPTFITLCSIPLSLVFAIVLMYFSDITLNVISLSALSISVGMLVDNSIVVIENIYRLRSKGANPIQAAVSGAKQVLGAITSSTLTTVCVFLPIVFVDGLTKQLFMDMALTMGYALMASLIVALTLVPAMASKMLKDDKPLKQDIMANIYTKYRPAVAWALDHKAIVLGVATAMLIGSAALAISRGFTFMPEMDSNTVTVTVTFDEETTKEEAMQISDEALKRISTIELIDTVGATMSTENGISVSMYVLLPEGTPGSGVAKEIETMCEDLDCNLSTSSAMMDMSMITGGAGVTMNVYSNNMEDLETAAVTIGKALEDLDGIDTVSNGLQDATTAIHVNIDRNKAMAKGFTTAQIYMQIATNLTTTATATSFELAGTSIDVIVEQPEEKKLTLDNLMNVTFTQSGAMGGEDTEFTLADVATIEETTTLTTINREDQRRYLTVSASLEEGRNVTLVTADAQDLVKTLTLPDSVDVDFGGENEMIMDAMLQLVLMLLLGMMLVYFIMVAQFQSLKSPFIVMFTIPLAFTGGFLALLLTGYEVSIISMIGFVMLVGIIVNNGIVLVEYINQLRAEGMERREAILEAGVTRIRPILMTSMTTILGQIVMAMGNDIGTALVQPMAIVCIGGLLYATLMTLFIVPVIYDMLNKKDLDIVSDEDLVILDI